MKQSDSLLQKLLHVQETHGGWIPWRELMATALYDPDHGYYAKNIGQVGPAGDFTTAPVLSPLLSGSVFQWQREKRKKCSHLRDAPFIEIGAGNGAFAAAFLKSRSLLTRGTPYWIVETSPPLRKLQQQLLGSRKVRWFSTITEAMLACDGRAFLFSNELVDAFPCSRWQFQDGQWKECALRIDSGKVWEGTLPTPLAPSSIFSQNRLQTNGQKVETHETFRHWLAEFSPLARRVCMLTIDYGGTSDSLYQKQPAGSLRAFYMQQRITGSALYARIGKQDLTADVNFSDLMDWSQALGWKTENLRPMSDWLKHQVGSNPQSFLLRPHASCSDPRFLDSADAGGAFMVIEADKGAVGNI